jgi:uncharacterized membrane protein YdfJ with MMPL/SSD domain
MSVALGGNVAERLSGAGFEDPSYESSAVNRELTRQLGFDADPRAVIVVRAPGGVRSPAARHQIAALASELGRDRIVGRVATPFNEARTPISRDGRTGLVAVNFTTTSQERIADAVDRLRELPTRAGVELVVGGFGAQFNDFELSSREDLVEIEMLALPLLVVLLVIVFRGLVAALLPIAIALVAVLGSFFVMSLINEVKPVATYALNVTTALGLGLAIDYGLLLVSRYREEIERVGVGPEALHTTMRTAGRTVMFSGLIVAVMTLSLLVFPQRLLYSVAFGAAATALLACLTALTVIPALLALLGERVNRLSVRRARRRGPKRGPWYRAARFAMRRPVVCAALTAAGLLLLASGVPDAHYSFEDASALPMTRESRQVYDAVVNEFGSRALDAPTTVVASGASSSVDSLRSRIAALDGVRSVESPRRLSNGEQLLIVGLAGQPFSELSQRTVDRIRGLSEGTRRVRVGGQAALIVDLKQSIAERLPLAFTLVGATAVVLLFGLTGSVVLAVKSLAMNALTVAGAFGVVVLVFGSINVGIAMVVFAVAMALSTDYGVFLLARIKELHDSGCSDEEAVCLGVQATGPILTAAAILLCVAVGLLMLSDLSLLQQVGLGVSVAVLLDATVVRLLLVPALMALFGRWNWWAPAALRRLRPGLPERT